MFKSLQKVKSSCIMEFACVIYMQMIHKCFTNVYSQIVPPIKYRITYLIAYLLSSPICFNKINAHSFLYDLLFLVGFPIFVEFLSLWILKAWEKSNTFQHPHRQDTDRRPNLHHSDHPNKLWLRKLLTTDWELPSTVSTGGVLSYI